MLLYSSIWAIFSHFFMQQPIHKQDKKSKFSILTQNKFLSVRKINLRKIFIALSLDYMAQIEMLNRSQVAAKD